VIIKNLILNSFYVKSNKYFDDSDSKILFHKLSLIGIRIREKYAQKWITI
jgi:hypothetical protein